MVQQESWFECGDGAKLFLRRWLPDGAGGQPTAPQAVVHIVHGMAEHAGRYVNLAGKLTGAGIEVWAADQRGHGRTADLSVNGPGSGGILGHCADNDGFSRVTADVYAVNQEIRKARPGIPLFLLGHSWGSFVTQNYIETYGESGDLIDGCLLSGTRGPGGLKERAGYPFLVFLAAITGQRRGSPIAWALADGPFNKPFRPNRTPFDWTTRDEAVVDFYANDPLSGKLCSSGFYRDMIGGLCRIHRSEAMARIRKSLPIYVFCGSADPVGEMGTSPAKLVNAYRSLGIKDIEFVQYPGARHETLNETNREEVMENLLAWILRRISDSPSSAGRG